MPLYRHSLPRASFPALPRDDARGQPAGEWIFVSTEGNVTTTKVFEGNGNMKENGHRSNKCACLDSNVDKSFLI